MTERRLAPHEVEALKVAHKLDHGFRYADLTPAERMVAAFVLTAGSCHACAGRQRLTLTTAQRNAVIVLKACAHYADGWGILVTNAGSHEQDGQAWVQYRTGLALVKKGLVEYDEQFGRIRLL